MRRAQLIAVAKRIGARVQIDPARDARLTRSFHRMLSRLKPSSETRGRLPMGSSAASDQLARMAESTAGCAISGGTLDGEPMETGRHSPERWDVDLIARQKCYRAPDDSNRGVIPFG